MTINPCECKGPGFCQRHQRPKSFSEWKKCQEDANFRDKLDQDVKQPTVSEGGVGSEVKAILAKFGFRPGPNCKCHEHQANWDKMGVQWCESHRPALVAALNTEARARGYLQAKIAENGGSRAIIEMAIASAKKKGYQ